MLKIHTDSPARSVKSREVQGAALALGVLFRDLTVNQVVDVAQALNTPVPEFFGAVDDYQQAAKDA